MRWLVVQGGLALAFVPWAVYAATTTRLEPLVGWMERYNPLVELVGGLVRFSTGYPGIAQEVLGQRTIASVVALFSALLVTGVATMGLIRDGSGKLRSLRAAFRERPVQLCLWYLTAPIAMMLAISVFRRLLVVRYVLMTAPAFLLLVALGLSRLFPKRTISVGAALLVLLFVPGLLARLPTPRTRDYRGAAAFIVGEAIPEDVLLVGQEHPRRVLEYYLRGHESQFRWCPSSLRDTSVEATQACLGDVRRVWVVLSDEPGRSERTNPPAPLARRFESVRSQSLFKVRVSLYERRETQTQRADDR